MDFEKLAAMLLTEKVLSASKWPDKIYSPSGKVSSGLFGSTNLFWREIKNLRKFTDSGSKDFKKGYEGSTGWEYEMILGLAHNKCFYSDITTSRDYERVSSQHHMAIKAKQDAAEQTITDEVFIDDISRGEVVWKGEAEVTERNNLIKANEYLLGFVCHFHSHPIVKVKTSVDQSQDAFTFFSRQDMQSLFSSSMQMIGLVTDRVWVACKTPESVIPDHRALQEITRTEVEKPWELAIKAYEIMSHYNIVLYHADYDHSFERVDEQMAIRLSAQDEHRWGKKQQKAA